MRSAVIYVVLVVAMVASVLAVTAAGGAVFNFDNGTNRAILFGLPFVLFFGNLVGAVGRLLGVSRNASPLAPNRLVSIGLFGLVAGAAATAVAFLSFGAEIDNSDESLLLAIATVAGIQSAAQVAVLRREERSETAPIS